MDQLASILKLEELIVVKPLRHSLVTRVAFCGGSGGSLIKKAEELGAQVYITGDIRYHAALDTWLCLIDAGHHSMEEKMMELFAEDLRRDAPGLEIKFFASRSPFSIYRPRETGND
ncbi:MAG: Nif3-like dinuclear metal center hexameric protein, partial [Desulfovibrio sp.]|nr:Nif3-like dinuclear metal center hexameric protein [Desulfovibrio sp.]